MSAGDPVSGIHGPDPGSGLGRERGMAGALRRVAALLGELAVPFQVVGGLAARAHGATRPLVDVDLYVPGARLADVAAAAAEHVTRRPERHRDEHWDLVFMKLDLGGVTVELAGAEDARYRDAAGGSWHDAAVDFAASERRSVLGVELPVMPRAQLCDYKRRLDRPVDREDLRQLGESPA